MKEIEKYEELTCFEVETIYKSGRKLTEIIVATDEEKMWELYDKHHNLSLVSECMVVDEWPQ